MTTTLPTICASISGRASALGVAIHDAGYQALGLNYKYVAIETTKLKETVLALRSLEVRGFGVSMPFKVDVIRLLDQVNDDVRQLNACNTVVNDKGKLAGFNTDWRGAVDALAAAGVSPTGKALIVGSGGVARALAYALKSAGWTVEVSARNRGTAKDLCKRFGLNGPLPFPPKPNAEIKLIVNATPDASAEGGAINLNSFPNATCLFDVVFVPPRTPLALAAQARGLKVVPGWQMLLHQAAHQFKLYTGHNAPLGPMQKALSAALGEL